MWQIRASSHLDCFSQQHQPVLAATASVATAAGPSPAAWGPWPLCLVPTALFVL